MGSGSEEIQRLRTASITAAAVKIHGLCMPSISIPSLGSNSLNQSLDYTIYIHVKA